MTASLPAAVAMLALAGSPASVGVGIQAGPVCLATTIHPGASHALPPVTVQDTGSGDESIALHVQKPPGTLPGRPVPPSWVKFTYPRKWLVLSQSSVTVSPGATANVPDELTVPSSAVPGSYVTWIGAAPAGGGTAAQVSLGAEAFAYLEFTVARPGAALRHVACVVPGARQASKAADGKGHRHHGPQAAADPPKVEKVTGREMQIAGVAAAVLAILAYLRRRA